MWKIYEEFVKTTNKARERLKGDVVNKIEERISLSISDWLKNQSVDMEVSFDEYMLNFKPKSEKAKINLVSILNIIYDYPLIAKFQKCQFDDIKFTSKTFPKIEVGLFFEACNFANADFSNVCFTQRVDFSRTQFNQGANFYRAQFKQNANFYWAKFQEEPNFDNTQFYQEANFAYTQFQKCNFYRTQFNQGANFYRAQFEQNANFHGARFGEESEQDPSLKSRGVSANFKNSVFDDLVEFKNVYFYCDAYFSHAHFKDMNLSESHFHKVANFYCAKSNGVFDFSFSIFHQPRFANFVGVNPLCSFEKFEEYFKNKSDNRLTKLEEKLKKKIKNQVVAERIQDGDIEKYLKEQFILEDALDIRDSFRSIKEILTLQTNTLDAQNWHVMEFYAKELELKYEENLRHFGRKILKEDRKSESSDQNSKKQQGDQNPDLKGSLKRKIDQMQLCFYRSISDHHTDLLKIIGHVLNTIGLFGVLLFMCRYKLNPEGFLETHSLKFFVDWFKMQELDVQNLLYILYGMIVIWISKVVRFVLEIFPHQISWLHFLRKRVYVCVHRISWLHSCVKYLKRYRIEVIVLFVLVGSIFMGLDVRIYLPLVIIFIIFLDNVSYVCVHRIGVFISSLIVSGIVCIQPKYILGVANLFGENKSGGENLLFFTYTLIMLLLLFSLQKTARKNSISHS